MDESTDSSVATSPAEPRQSSSLGRRVLTGIVFVPVLVSLAWVGGWAFAGFVTLLVGLGMWEFVRLARTAGPVTVPLGLSVVGGVVAAPLAYLVGPPILGPLVCAYAVVALGSALAWDGGLLEGAVTLLGWVYVAVLLGHLVLLRSHVPGVPGPEAVILTFLLTWACDTGAYGVGRTLGRHRPWPKISPNKSTEGAIGGAVCTIAAALLARVWFMPALSVGDAIVIGLAVGVFCQLGDLIESMLKRQAGVKDSSTLIPGHGGVLDRFDSMMVSAPATYYLLGMLM